MVVAWAGTQKAGQGGRVEFVVVVGVFGVSRGRSEWGWWWTVDVDCGCG